LVELDVIGTLVTLSEREAEELRQQNMGICRVFFNRSDGTRTRDLRRDRPVMALPG
jgi:hypothetical protein